MKLGLMQPYFLPYIGYWQLLNAVDQYIVYDDVNFIKGGWINRNRMLVEGLPKYMNVQMEGASSFKCINEIKVNPSDAWRRKLLLTIQAAYKKAPYYQDVYPMVEKIIQNKEENLALYLFCSIQEVCNYLGITTKLHLSSHLQQNRSLRAQERVIDICKNQAATEYYNAVGGQELYSFERFKTENMQLKFLKTNDIVYSQFDDAFVGNLSILDMLMFNAKETVQTYLNEYSLIEETAYR